MSGVQPTTRGPYRTGIKRRQQIVAAAAEAFAARGYDGASLRQIAADAGISAAALLRHFERKEDLLAAVLEWWAGQTTALTEEGETGLAVFERLGEVMRYHTRNRGLLELFVRLTGEATHDDHPARAFIQNRYADLVATLVARLVTAADAGEVAPVTRSQAEAEVRYLCAVMDGLEIQWLLDPGVDLVGLFDQHLAATLDRWKAGP
ncbi:AcrR family transcriptional regulator [Kibdelosporangium banguiense]|uniref:AcrR family transcriptional regulator n=1 Tax=Kibdelosporangium banguiense TaxID=1365924 RepID=A0ABS4TV55_9PSEU|nr:TetR/AcrR family transcriptional regulator [Kibdelosporangium banguiense]MBP2328272.1 AcrR family transcriptional regulator [Kibdelosporangium banguiense]